MRVRSEEHHLAVAPGDPLRANASRPVRTSGSAAVRGTSRQVALPESENAAPERHPAVVGGSVDAIQQLLRLVESLARAIGPCVREIDLTPGNRAVDLREWCANADQAWLAKIGVVATDLAESYRAGLLVISNLTWCRAG